MSIGVRSRLLADQVSIAQNTRPEDARVRKRNRHSLRDHTACLDASLPCASMTAVMDLSVIKYMTDNMDASMSVITARGKKRGGIHSTEKACSERRVGAQSNVA